MKQAKRILALVLALLLALPTPVYAADDSAAISPAETGIVQEQQEYPAEEPVRLLDTPLKLRFFNRVVEDYGELED